MTRIPHDERRELVRRIRTGELTASRAARDYGISRQYAWQIVNRIDPQAIAQGRAVRRVAAQARLAARRAARRAAHVASLDLPPCCICYGPIDQRYFKGGRARTCSPRCAELWRISRFHLDDDARRRHAEAVNRYLGAPPPRKTGPWQPKSPKIIAALEEVTRLRLKHLQDHQEEDT